MHISSTVCLAIDPLLSVIERQQQEVKKTIRTKINYFNLSGYKIFQNTRTLGINREVFMF